MKADSALYDDTKKLDADEELELLLEAARRANWDAMHGPPHLRNGQFFVSQPSSVQAATQSTHADESDSAR
jgi:hypothetical protein